MTEPTTPQAPAKLFAIVELFGHGRVAGQISEQTFAGAELLRVDVPEVSYTDSDYVDGQRQVTTVTIPAHTRSFGPRAIYGISWCDEAAALLAAHTIRDRPITTYSLRSALDQLTPGERRHLIGRSDDGEPLPGDQVF